MQLTKAQAKQNLAKLIEKFDREWESGQISSIHSFHLDDYGLSGYYLSMISISRNNRNFWLVNGRGEIFYKQLRENLSSKLAKLGGNRKRFEKV